MFTNGMAEKSARRALDIDPAEAKGCNVLGQVLDWQGQHDEATGYLERAFELNPSFAQASTETSCVACRAAIRS